MAINYKTAEELAIMREAGRINNQALAAMRAAIRPGISTLELDQIGVDVLAQHGAEAAFLGYPPDGPHPFPATITICINDELVHGIPSADRILQEGDIVSIDCGTVHKGFVGDSAFSAGVGKISPAAQRLLDVTDEALRVAIAACVVGNGTKDVARSVQKYVEKQGYSVVREYTGHGVGQNMHEEPQVPNWWPRGRLARRQGWQSVPLKPGMVLALEPMIIVGRPETRLLDDHWTVVTKDGSLCAHTEHSIAVTEGKPLILTADP